MAGTTARLADGRRELEAGMRVLAPARGRRPAVGLRLGRLRLTSPLLQTSVLGSRRAPPAVVVSLARAATAATTGPGAWVAVARAVMVRAASVRRRHPGR